MNSNYFLLTFILLSSLTFGQNKIPKISGTAKFSVERGTIDCDITLSDYSHLRDYLIRLNKGLNILNIQNVESKPFLLNYDREFSDTLQTDETVSYYIPANIRGEKYLPTKLRFQYTGKFPVINDTISENFQKSDWRGNITFMNGLLRVDGFQSGLFPTLYDIDTDYQFDIIKYDIEIICEDCEQIYMNGSLPVNNNHARFKADSPKEPYLFIGKYNIQNGENITLLNADFNKEQVLEFDKINGEIVEFLSSYTNISYKEKIYWVQAYLTTEEKGYFAFASNPTFTICGNPPSDLKTTFNNQLKGGFLLTIAHELSHYYFGTIKNCNTTLENLINEGFTEFMSLKFAQNLGMEEQVRQSIMERLEYVADDNFKFKPIGTIENLHDINDRETYGYDYQTLILFSIEKEIGEAKMKKWIQLLLQDQKPISDKIFLKQTLKTAVENDKIYTNIINKYFHGTNTIKNIYKTLSK